MLVKEKPMLSLNANACKDIPLEVKSLNAKLRTELRILLGSRRKWTN